MTSAGFSYHAFNAVIFKLLFIRRPRASQIVPTIIVHNSPIHNERYVFFGTQKVNQKVDLKTTISWAEEGSVPKTSQNPVRWVRVSRTLKFSRSVSEGEQHPSNFDLSEWVSQRLTHAHSRLASHFFENFQRNFFDWKITISTYLIYLGLRNERNSSC